MADPTQNNIVLHRMTGGPTGDVVTLPYATQAVRITTTGDCWVRVPVYGPQDTYAAPTAPVATPLPAAGGEAATGWVHLSANSTWNAPPLQYGYYYKGVAIWEITADGEVTIDGTQPGWGR